MSGEGGQVIGTPDGNVGTGQYSIIAKLGQGGMAGVYLAVARGPVSDFHKLVVLKRLHDTLREDAGFVRMFVREAKIAARLNHPNVVHTYSVDVEAGQPVIVMEYLDGVSLSALRKRLQKRPLDERLPLLAVIAQALAGLHYVHELADYDGTPMGLIHRDIKPANVFVTFDGQVKVLDFGIAKATAPGQDNTNSRVLKGTARYMAPEAVGGGDIDRRADVFSTGVMLWEAASGKRLWQDSEELKIIRRLMDNDVPTLDSVSPDTPEALTAMCKQALQLDPDDRQQTAGELRTALLSFLASRGVNDIEGLLRSVMEAEFSERRELRAATIRERLAESARAATSGNDDMRTLPSGGASISTASSDPLSSPSGTSVHTASPPSRSWLPLVLAGAASLVLGGGAVWMWMSSDPSRSSDPAAKVVAPAQPPAEPAPKPEPEPEAEPAPKPEPEAEPEPEPEPAPTPAENEAVQPEPAPAATPAKRRRGRKKNNKPTSVEPAPETPPAAESKADRPLKPGEMPTKKNKKNSGLSLDKDSPWGGRP